MSIVVDLKTKLTSITSDIYLNDIPDTPDNMIALFNAGGDESLHAMDQITSEVMMLQTRVRHTIGSDALRWCYLIQEQLDGMHTETINSNLYLSVFQTSDILNLGKDDRGRSRYSVNFRVRVKFA